MNRDLLTARHPGQHSQCHNSTALLCWPLPRGVAVHHLPPHPGTPRGPGHPASVPAADPRPRVPSFYGAYSWCGVCPAAGIVPLAVLSRHRAASTAPPKHACGPARPHLMFRLCRNDAVHRYMRWISLAWRRVTVAACTATPANAKCILGDKKTRYRAGHAERLIDDLTFCEQIDPTKKTRRRIIDGDKRPWVKLTQ